jgi:hypothetical protein
MTGTDSPKLVLLACLGIFKFQHCNSSTGSPFRFMQHKKTETNPGYERNGDKFWLITMFMFVTHSAENLITISALNKVNCNALDFSFQFWACASVEDILKHGSYVRMYINTFMQHADIRTCARAHTHTHTHTRDACIHTYIHSYIHSFIHSFIHHSFCGSTGVTKREGCGTIHKNTNICSFYSAKYYNILQISVIVFKHKQFMYAVKVVFF